MDRRLGVVALAALVLLSGCPFLDSLPGGGTPTPTGTDPPTADETTPTAGTPTAAPPPDGYGPSGVENFTLALDSHRSGLVDTGSFSVSYQATVATENGHAGIASVRTTNVSQAVGYEATNVTNGAMTERYVTNGKAYVRTDPAGGDVYYNRSSAVYDAREYTATELVRPALENVTYMSAERMEQGNRTFFRFRASRVTDLESLLGSRLDPANVTSFDAALVVSEDGVVQRVGHWATVEREGGTLTLRVRIDVTEQLGVSLGEPGWVEEARRAT
jgi:hypothetical protein